MNKPILQKTGIELSEEVRNKVIVLLNQTLANLSDLQSQVYFAHWNVRGMHFIALHKLFEGFVEEIAESIDQVAERVSTLGGVALGTVRMAAAASELEEIDPENFQGEALVPAICKSYAATTNACRMGIRVCSDLEDDNSTDLLTQISRGLDKNLWFLEAHLRGK